MSLATLTVFGEREVNKQTAATLFTQKLPLVSLSSHHVTMSDDELRFSHLEENSDSDDDEDEVSKKAIFHTDVSPEQKKTKGLRHLKDLKNSLGVA